MKKAFYSLSLITLLLLSQSVIWPSGVEDYCTKDELVVNNGHCTTTEGMPSEEGEGSVDIKRCEEVSEGPNPLSKNCSGNSMNPKPI